MKALHSSSRVHDVMRRIHSAVRGTFGVGSSRFCVELSILAAPLPAPQVCAKLPCPAVDRYVRASTLVDWPMGVVQQ